MDLTYATFRPGCLTLKAQDQADPSRFTLQEVALGQEPAPSRTVKVAVFRKEDWSRRLVLTATAYERSCAEQNPRQVDAQTLEAEVPAEGIALVSMALRAEDLDDDHYVKVSQGGTDCDDDDPAVNPGILDDCDGKDDNCSGDESDAPGVIVYYADVDGDGYGNPATRQASCVQPTGTATNGLDCNDTNAAVRPNQRELLCNGQDENCDSVADDSFDVSRPCTTALGCSGAWACTPDQRASQCVSPETPRNWYVDEDGDQRAGRSVGPGCVPPVAGAVDRQDDCDDSSPFAFSGGTERCDRLDNDCNGQVDEVGCGSVAWRTIPGTGNTEWRALAAYADGRAWVASPTGALAHVAGGVATAYPDCAGQWLSAWARPSDGRVFLGSEDGRIATHAVTGGVDCSTAGENTSTGTSSQINGLVGFENGASTTLFAVTSNGRIYRWTYPGNAPPVELAGLGANLRSIHGTSPTNLLAVGVDSSSGVPRAFRFDPTGGVWVQESLPASLPKVFLRDVHMVHGQLAYAAGDQGVVLERSNGAWKEVTRLDPGGGPPPNIHGLTAFGRTAIYAVTNDKKVYLFNGSWSSVESLSWTPRAIDGVGPHDVWAAGSQGTVIRWSP
ncbi:MopE-related protein [Hyalangium gracile]|uniref:MopE-related protein n=1 Tax=Hyalangium gracile TaxID=394092 RepID=UPI001CCD355A|nr:MopE-related protein [Hyalangium gracile]